MLNKLIFIIVALYPALVMASGGYIEFEGNNEPANRISFYLKPHSFNFKSNEINNLGYTIQQNFSIKIKDSYGKDKSIYSRLGYQFNPSFSKIRNGLISTLFLNKDTINLVSKDIKSGDNIECRIVSSSPEGANAACYTNDDFKGIEFYTNVQNNKRYLFSARVDRLNNDILFYVFETVDNEIVKTVGLGSYHINGIIVGLTGGTVDIEKFLNGESCHFGNMDYDFNVALSKTFGSTVNGDYIPKAKRNSDSWTCPPYEFTKQGNEYRVQALTKESFNYKVVTDSYQVFTLKYNLANEETESTSGSEFNLRFEKDSGVMLSPMDLKANSVEVYIGSRLVGTIEGNEAHLFFKNISNSKFDIVKSDKSIYQNRTPTGVRNITVESEDDFSNAMYMNKIIFHM